MLDERLLVLTFAIEDAVVRRDWQEVNVLFEERGQLLNSATKLNPSGLLALIEADSKLHQRLQSEHTTVTARLRTVRKATAAKSLYLKVAQMTRPQRPALG